LDDGVLGEEVEECGERAGASILNKIKYKLSRGDGVVGRK
jgi:hypothetical protein